MADGRDAMADIDREVRILASLHALEEIVVLALGIGIKMNLLRPDNRVEDLFGTGLDFTTPAAISHPAVGADEFDAGIAGCAGHDNAVFVPVGYVVILDGVIQSSLPKGAG